MNQAIISLVVLDEATVTQKYTISVSALEDIKTKNAIKNPLFPVSLRPIGQVRNPELEENKTELEAGSTENYVTGKYAIYTTKYEEM